MMNDEEMMKVLMKVLRTLITAITSLLMCITLVLYLLAFEALVHTILCGCILLLMTIELIFDGILKDSKNMKLHVFSYVIWFISMIETLFNF